MNTYKVKYKLKGKMHSETMDAQDMEEAVAKASKYDKDASDLISVTLTTTPSGRPRSLDNFVLKQAAELVVRDQYATVNYLCRHLGIGNARANRIMDRLEECGIVGPFKGSKPREVLISSVTQANIILHQTEKVLNK